MASTTTCAGIFGPPGDTVWNRKRLESAFQRFRHREVDIRDRQRVIETVREIEPEPSGGGTKWLPGIAICSYVDEQGLWRCA